MCKERALQLPGGASSHLGRETGPLCLLGAPHTYGRTWLRGKVHGDKCWQSPLYSPPFLDIEGNFQSLVIVFFSSNLKVGRLPSKKKPIFWCSGFRWVFKPSSEKSNYEHFLVSPFMVFFIIPFAHFTSPSRLFKVTTTFHFSVPL